MEYKGKLYGKIGKGYFPMEATTEDYEELQKRVDELESENKALRQPLVISQVCEHKWNDVKVKKLSSNNMLADSLPLDNCTRLEVINHKDQDKLGRAYVHWKDDNKIEGSLQDGGRTLKLFITKR